jgi:hypothetical protein
MSSLPAGGRFLHIYCDESRQTADRYMVIGGLIIDRAHEVRWAELMARYRDEYNMHAELKWSKVSRQKLPEYKALIDLFCRVNRAVHFKAIVVDTHEIDNRRYNKNDAELGFYKLMYQFLLHSFGSYLHPADRCLVFVDQRTTSRYKLSTLCAILNNGLCKKYPRLERPVRNIQALDSKSSDLIQLADVLMGAIGYEMNGANLRVGAKEAKVLLARYIAECLGLPHLQTQTARGRLEFSIWHFHFRRRSP